MLDVVAAAAWSTTDAARSAPTSGRTLRRRWSRSGGLLRLFGPMFDNRVKTDDQSGPLKTATYESMAAFMKTNGLLEAAYSLNYQP